MHTTEVTPERDEHNKRMIAMSLFNYMGAPRSAKQLWLLNEATPEERDAHVRKQNKRLLAVICLVAGYFVLTSLLPRETVPPHAAPEVSLAGQVQNIQLHESTFSRTSTVVTSTGTFQVWGGVSASVGDEAFLKKVLGSSRVKPKIELCIDSKIKSRCYDVL